MSLLDEAMDYYREKAEAKAARRAKFGPTEADIQRKILAWCEANGVLAWRNSTGVFRRGETYIQCGIPGQADITGILPGGRRLEVECKSAPGRQTKHQARFQKHIEDNGGLYILARSVDDVREAIQAARVAI